jgi:hypothetical protein
MARSSYIGAGNQHNLCKEILADLLSMITETLTWKPVVKKPGSDISVLLFDPAAS